MNVVIVEDEVLTAKRLCQLLAELQPDIKILTVLDSIDMVVKWILANPAPDLMFLDIQLSDGLSFEIFNRVKIECPVIFTTAFDEYAVRAFKVNSIDYLLKPINPKELKQALEKFHTLRQQTAKQSADDIAGILSRLNVRQPVYKARFLIKSGQQYIPIDSGSVAFFEVINKITWLYTFSGKKLITDYTLEGLDNDLDPAVFFRANRQIIVNINAIESVHSFLGGSLKLKINPQPSEPAVVSRRRAAEFKQWMEK